MNPIYMDNAASTKVKPNVLAKFIEIADNLYGNPSSKHKSGYLADVCIEEVKENISAKLNCNTEDVFFTSGATMSNNILIQGMLRKHPETVFITSTVEHNDIMMLYDWLPYTKHLIDVNGDGIIDLTRLTNYVSDCMHKGVPCLVSIQMANSETGIIQPIKKISKIVHSYKYGYLHVDATQYIPYYPIDMIEMDIDALSMSGQKIGGIKGSGLLVARQVIRDNIVSVIFGEQGLVGGTPSTPLIASLDEAFNQIDYDTSSLQHKRDVFLSYLESLDGVLIGTKNNRLPNNIYIRFPGISGLTLMNLLNGYDIYIGTGSACSTDSDKPSHVALAYGLSENEALECIRFTLSDANTYEEIEYVVKIIKNIIQLLKEE